MTTWLVFMQVILDLGLLLGIFLVWARFNRPQKEDARLSKGLQLLQSKIAILEDLSDRTDVQVRQLSALLAAKAVEVHQKTAEADRQIQAIEKNMQKSLELSKIFQDKIPHREIIERENSYKYIEAARMANQGKGADEISQKLAIPPGEVEVIINMNKDQLIFREEEVPAWARPEEGARSLTRSLAEESAVAPLKEFGSLSHADILSDDTLVDYNNPVAAPYHDTPPPMPVEIAEAEASMPRTAPVIDNSGVRPYVFPKIEVPGKKSF